MSDLQPPPPDYDDNPEWTDEDVARARPADEVLPPQVVAALVRADIAKEEVALELDEDVLDKFQATGLGWQSRINAALRAAMPFVDPVTRDAA